MFEFPNEIILHCLQYLDPISLTKLSLVCRKMNGLAQDNSLWLPACFNHPTANALIQAAGIEPLLRSSIISPVMFLKNLLANDIDSLKPSLFPEGTKRFSLWLASYETPSPSFFYKPPPHLHRPLFLTKEIGQDKTPNASSVREWLHVSVPINAEQFESLMKQKMVPYKEKIESTQIRSCGLKISDRVNDFTHQ